ncbi:phenol-soluble modulin export ABC transporter ATP-binding protein PmtA [Staphylococcus capitis]|uniref:phenol-soluble modulin export ABC transporter ATP-binding protein PmtA n=1 Tax=Staphylococcus capitis TaxID=29388 RepID=UPI0018883386|nr:ABC transporter ATP-binding protein [Staphylococcus capitis]MBF2262416.1 ABC transporter ATP-binding protein [Staphylococcus capitis]MBF2283042.1 ABC transporter ATP-binding protein [Staphylococcus capitis]
MNAIELKNVSYQTKDFQLKDISFEVPKGFVTGFIGGNGAGKTTVIRLIMDLIQSKSGQISVFNEQMKDSAVEIKNKIGFVYSETYFNDKWTIKKLENIVAPFYNNWDHKIFMSYLQFFQLPYKKKIKTFSTGMKMKLSLAIAFSHHAELFILDEPTSGLDPLVRNELLEIIQQELIDEEKTVFISTHIISDLEKIADYIVYLRDGQIIFNESRDTLFEKYKIISGSNEDLDVELEELLIYKEVRKTGYIGLTEHYQTFKELFGNRVEIKNPSIEELMIYLEKNKNQLDFKYHQRNEKLI